MPRSDADWEGLVEAATALSMILKRKPKHLKRGYSVCPGSILNAYREGDLTFKEAVKRLEQWKKL